MKCFSALVIRGRRFGCDLEPDHKGLCRHEADRNDYPDVSIPFIGVERMSDPTCLISTRAVLFWERYD
jgi:hypothetical protein